LTTLRYLNATRMGAFMPTCSKHNAAECGLGFEVDLSIIQSAAGAAYYGSKYLGKNLEDHAWPKSMRRVNTSRGWPKLPEYVKELGWAWFLLGKRDGLMDTISGMEEIGLTVLVLDYEGVGVLLSQTPPE